MLCLSGARLKHVAAVAALLLTSACGEPECPPGFDKVGKVCKRQDAGSAVVAGEGGVSADSGAITTAADGGAITSGDDSGMVGTASGIDSGPAAMVIDSGASPAAAPDAAVDTDASVTPAPECDGTHPCATGSNCVANKCVSACATTQCDPNATCALVAGAAVCTCNTGFVTMMSGTTKTCARDVACDELRCDANASCEVGSNGLRQCTCKSGYTGSGMSCVPVSCPTLRAPASITIDV